MVNFSLNAGSLMGIVLALAGAGLYFLRSFRPNLARDYDVFFAAIALLCGGILFFQSWRLDPILQFGVFLLSGSTVFFAVDSIRLRDIATEQAKRNTPLVDDDRPVSRSYQYQSEDYGPGYGSFADQRSSPVRRIRGSRDPRDFRDGGYDEGNGWDEYDDRRGNRRPPRSLDRSR
ncbi:MAG: Ycf66 family protein, partial [Prochlorothrix sp.]